MFFSFPPGVGFSFSNLPKWLWEDEPAASPSDAAAAGPDAAAEAAPPGAGSGPGAEAGNAAAPGRGRRLVYQGYQWSAQPTWLPMANPVLDSWSRTDIDAEREKATREQGARQAMTARQGAAKVSDDAASDKARHARQAEDVPHTGPRPGEAAADLPPGTRGRPDKGEPGA